MTNKIKKVNKLIMNILPTHCLYADEDKNKSIGKCICISIALAVFLTIIIVPLSFSKVHYYEIGLIKNRTTGTVDRTKIYESGYHNIGPVNEFLTYPAMSQLKSLDKLSIWSSASESDAGIYLEIDISFSYNLIKEKLGDLYNKVGVNYDSLITNLAISTFKNEAVKWSADEYLFKRRIIEKRMLKEIAKILEEEAHCKVTSLQLRDIIFPPSFYTRKLDTAVQIQKNIAETYTSQANIIKGETSQLVQYIINRGIQTTKLADSQSINIKSFAATEALKMIQDARINGLSLIRTELGIADPKQFLSLDYMLQLEKSGRVDYLINFDKSDTTLNIS